MARVCPFEVFFADPDDVSSSQYQGQGMVRTRLVRRAG